jgi:hypothetical protein
VKPTKQAARAGNPARPRTVKIEIESVSDQDRVKRMMVASCGWIPTAAIKEAVFAFGMSHLIKQAGCDPDKQLGGLIPYLVRPAAHMPNPKEGRGR